MRVAVLGAGIAGLAAAHGVRREAERRGTAVDLAVYEAGSRAGGRIRTTRDAGYLVEWAANGLLSNATAALALVTELGMGRDVVPSRKDAARRYIYADGRLHLLPLGPVSLARFGALSARSRLRVFAEPLLARRSAGEESVHAFAARHVGEEAAIRLIGTAVKGVYAGDARALSVDAAFPRMRELESKHRSLVVGMIRERKAPGGTGPLWSLAEGLESVVRRLTDGLGPALHLGAPALAIERSAEWGPGGRIRVRLASGATEGFDAVIVATPAREAAALLRGVDSGVAGGLAEIESAGVAVVALAFPTSAFRHAPDGYGFLVAPGEDLPVLGVLFESNLFPGRAPESMTLVRAMLGGVERPELLARGDAELVALACGALDRALGLKSGPERTWVIRQERAIPQYPVGHKRKMDETFGRLEALPGLHLVGNAYRGISVGAIAEEARAVAGRVLA
jgi:protoporphyrinogen/coproporphyrinogen III oxidase